MFAAYNAWCNERLYEAAAKVPDDEYRADRGAFFKSLHGTLNHLLVADRIWMRRFTGAGEAPPALNTILFDRFEDLRAARRSQDVLINRYIDGLDQEKLTGMFRYKTVTTPQKTIEQPLAPALDHFFNHQTHHRGQAHALLTAIGGKDAAPSLDLLILQRETGMGLGSIS
ncbi:MAG TPA: DinB family protein [Pseudolabrys sp.]|nr:DinB family protein [Pseudolabrys sp.]